MLLPVVVDVLVVVVVPVVVLIVVDVVVVIDILVVVDILDVNVVVVFGVRITAGAALIGNREVDAVDGDRRALRAGAPTGVPAPVSRYRKSGRVRTRRGNSSSLACALPQG